MDIETECKRAAGEQCGGESSEDAVRLPVNGPQEQHDGEGQEQVRLQGAGQKSCPGKVRLRLVEVEKKNDGK